MADEPEEPMQPQLTEPSLEILGVRNRGGRPRVDVEPLEPVMTRIPVRNYDQLVKAANKSDQSVSELVRKILMAQSFLR